MAAIEQPPTQSELWRFHARYVYAAKFLCGELSQTEPEGPVRPGRYSTAINVHNPNSVPVIFHKKAVLLYNAERPEDADERPVPPALPQCSNIKQLDPDYGLEIDCRDIRETLLQDASGQPGPQAPIFIKGWVVIETVSDLTLDVVAVYTTEGLKGPVSAPSIEIERVPGTQTFLFG